MRNINNKSINKQDLLNYRGGEELGGYCCLVYMKNPSTYYDCVETAVWGECPPDDDDFEYVNTTCYMCLP